MNFFQLVLKQMRQRLLSTWLTLFSVALGVGLAVAVMIFHREGQKLFLQSDYGYDLIIGAKGSPLQLVMNTVYHLDRSPGNIPYAVYAGLDKSLAKSALPFEVGDEYRGFRVMGTLPQVFPVDYEGKAIEAGQVFEYRLGRKFVLAEGRAFHPKKFEAVLGSEVARGSGLKIGGKLKVQHGTGAVGDVHDEQWTVVGVLGPTRTANDRVVFLPLVSLWAIPEHEKGMEEMAQLQEKHGAKEGAHAPATGPATAQAGGHHDHEEAYDLEADGTIDLHLEQSKWKISGIFVRTGGGFETQTLYWQFNNLPDAMAVAPAEVMREFFSAFLEPSTQLLLLIAVLVTIVAAVSILVSIYNSVSARRKEIAILRALGATRRRVLLLICFEAGLVGLMGGVMGMVGGHVLAAGGSAYMAQLTGEGLQWMATGLWEWIYLGVVVILAAVAGLVPALKAYSTPVATNLVSA